MQYEDHELKHLKLGEVMFPPEIWLESRSQHGEEVVGVHHDVDPAVEEPAEGGVASADKLW